MEDGADTGGKIESKETWKMERIQVGRVSGSRDEERMLQMGRVTVEYGN